VPVTTEDLLINISANTKKSAEAIEGITDELAAMRGELKDVTKSSKDTAKQTGDTGAAMLKLSATINVVKEAYSAMKGVIDETVQAFAIQDSAERRLLNTLKATQQFTNESFKSWKEYASQLQVTANLGDEVGLEFISMAKAMRLTDDQTKSLIEASVNLNAVTQKGLQPAFEALLSQLSGEVGEVKKLVPELANLTAEELKMGKGIDLVAEKFAGFAANEAQEFAGSLQALENSTGDLMETFGDLSVEIFNLREVYKEANSEVQAFDMFLKDSKDTIVAAGKTIISFVDDIGNILAGAIQQLAANFVSIGAWFTEFANSIVQLGNLLGVFSDDTAAKVQGATDDINRLQSELEIGATAAFEAIGDTSDTVMERMSEQVREVDQDVKSLTDSTDDLGKSLKQIKEEGKKAYETLDKMVVDLRKSNELIGATEGEMARARAQAAQEQISDLEEQLKLAGLLDEKGKGLVEQARQLAAIAGEKELTELRKRNLDELLAGNKELMLQMQADSMTQQELIDAETDLIIDQLKAKTDLLELDEAGKEALQDQIELLKERAELTKQRAPSPEFQQFAKMGASMASDISGIMTQGALSMVGGIASGVGAIVQAVDGLLDAIPGLIDQVAGIFDKITALPQVLLESVRNLGRALEDYIRDYIPNLFEAVPEIVDEILTAVAETLPNAFVDLMERLPEIMDRFMDRIPEIVESFVTGWITRQPKIWMAMMEFMVAESPRIALKMVEVMWTELPKAMIAGVVEAGKQLVEMLRNFFTGKGFKLDIDTEGIKKAAKDLSRTLTGAASELFAVLDLQQQAKAAQDAKEIANQVADGFRQGINIFWEMWNKAMKWLQGIWDGVWSKFEEFWNWLERIWKSVWTEIEKWWSALEGIWNDVWEKIGTLGQTIWDNLVEAASSIADWGQQIWDGLSGALGEFSFEQLGKDIWNGLKAVFDDSLFKDLGKGIWNAFKTAFDGKHITKMLNELNPLNLFDRIFDTSKAFTKPGTVEGILGINIPFVSFAQGGILGGTAQVSGDSELNDRILALLSPGEAVIPRSKMDIPFIREIVQTILDAGPRKLNLGAFLETLGVGNLNDINWGSIDFSQLDPTQIDWTQVSAENLKQAATRIATDAWRGVEAGWEAMKDVLADLGLLPTLEMFKDRLLNELTKGIRNMLMANRLDSGLDTALGTHPFSTAEAVRIAAPGTLAIDLGEYHKGGLVPRDGVGRLKQGEFVVESDAVSAVGVETMSRINRGETVGGDTNISISLDIKTTQPIDETFVRQRLMPQIKDEFRRASLDGAFILSAAGVRA
jgi:hypothetical protein